MTTAVATSSSDSNLDSSRPLFVSLLRSELIKLRTIRSTWWCMGAMAILFLIVAAVASPVWAAHYPDAKPEEKAAFEAISFSLQGGGLAQIAIGVMGILFITGEYSSGMIRTTFTAAPQRRQVMLAKAVALIVPTFVISLLVAFPTFLIGQFFLKSTGVSASLGDYGTYRMIFGSALYLAVTAIIGLGIGSLIRHTGGAITLFVGLQFVLPPLLLLVPEDIRNNIFKYLMSTSGTALFSLHRQPENLAPWAGFGVYCVWAAAALFGAIALIRSRDA